MEAITGAADISGLSGNVSSILVGIVALSVLFVAARYVKKAMGR